MGSSLSSDAIFVKSLPKLSNTGVEDLVFPLGCFGLLEKSSSSSGSEPPNSARGLELKSGVSSSDSSPFISIIEANSLFTVS